jgi:hypothetical protein
MNKLSPERQGKRFTVETGYGNYYIATKHPRDIIAMCGRIENADLLCDRANAYHANQQEIAELQATAERLRELLQTAVNDHTKRAFITCEETCWCWDAQNLLTKTEASHEME